MDVNRSAPRYQSALAPLMEQFVELKRASGYRFNTGAGELGRFDRYLSEQALRQCELPRSVTRNWLTKRSHESAATQQNRARIVRDFARFMCGLGYPAYVPDRSLSCKQVTYFAPRILTHAEIERLLQTVDQMPPGGHSPLRHLVMPELFRLLYGCGFRVNEVLHLHMSDVDLDRGILTVRDGKFGKDRLVPPAVSLVERLKRFNSEVGPRKSDDYFFPTLHGGPWSLQAVYQTYRELLLRCGIAHGGRGKGPRVHDLRHTFAVHTLLRWYREGVKLDAKLPVLAAYLGHQSLAGTARYLHLTAELFPEITARSNAEFGDVIPRRVEP